jgi:hypothetical protein
MVVGFFSIFLFFLKEKKKGSKMLWGERKRGNFILNYILFKTLQCIVFLNPQAKWSRSSALSLIFLDFAFQKLYRSNLASQRQILWMVAHGSPLPFQVDLRWLLVSVFF